MSANSIGIFIILVGLATIFIVAEFRKKKSQDRNKNNPKNTS